MIEIPYPRTRFGLFLVSLVSAVLALVWAPAIWVSLGFALAAWGLGFVK